jgi:hypothetical protein
LTFILSSFQSIIAKLESIVLHILRVFQHFNGTTVVLNAPDPTASSIRAIMTPGEVMKEMDRQLHYRWQRDPT